MGIVDQKRQIFGQIGALNVLNDDYPKLPKLDSLPSVNNNTNPTDFLLDLLNSLVGFEVLKDHVVDTITYGLDKVEDIIKDGLKLELKEIVSCNVNPSIPTWFQSGGSGVTMKVNNIDFFDIMKVNPTTAEGSLIYTDITAEALSQDFNTYLYFTIQEPDTEKQWGSSVLGTDMLQTTFVETGPTQNNLLKFTTSPNFDDHKLAEFNNKFIDSLTLFGSPNSINSKSLINLLIEDLFGSISVSKNIKKSKKQLKKEAEVRELLDCIINSETDVIDDSYFEFDNPTLAKIEADVNNRKNGFRTLQTCGNIVSQITTETLVANQELIDNSTTKEEEYEAVSQTLDNLANEQASNTQSSVDVQTVKGNFFIEMIKKFVRVVMSIIISPKLITLFAINHQIIYGQGTSYEGPIDFIKKNKKIVKNISKMIANAFISLLLKLALKYLSFKLRQKLTEDEIEKAKNYVLIVSSYIGLPPDVTNHITNL